MTDEPPVFAARVAAFSIWFTILFFTLGFCLVGLPVLVLIYGMLRWPTGRVGIAHKLSARSRSDRIAWLAFGCGVLAMWWITFVAAISETDGDYRTWDQIRFQSRLLVAAGIFGAGVPLLVTLAQLIRGQTTLRSSPSSGKAKLVKCESDLDFPELD